MLELVEHLSYGMARLHSENTINRRRIESELYLSLAVPLILSINENPAFFEAIYIEADAQP